MDDEAKYGRETMNKVLGWGTIVYFLVLGFSGNQHALFELYYSDDQIKLETAKTIHAAAMDSESNTVTDPSKATELKAKAAQARFEVMQLREERQDARWRAILLIAAVSIYCFAYPVAIYFFYGKSVTRHKATYFISARLAYAVRHRNERNHPNGRFNDFYWVNVGAIDGSSGS